MNKLLHILVLVVTVFLSLFVFIVFKITKFQLVFPVLNVHFFLVDNKPTFSYTNYN